MERVQSAPELVVAHTRNNKSRHAEAEEGSKLVCKNAGGGERVGKNLRTQKKWCNGEKHQPGGYK